MAKKRFKLIEFTENRGEVPIEDWVYGDSAEQVLMLMRMTNRNVKIIYEEDVPSENAQPQPVPVEAQPLQSPPSVQQPPPVTPPPPVIQERRISASLPKKAPLYYNIGTNEFKLEDGNLYLKIWRNATADEVKQIQIISEKTKKPISLVGKIIQVTDWQLTEGSNERIN